jgi:3',5'-cyclic-AMP phosphodiesterase
MANPIKLLHITDTHILATPEQRLLGVDTAHYFREVVRTAFNTNPIDAVVMTGDLAQDPCLASYQYIRNIMTAYPAPCVCLPGNHDDMDLMRQLFNTEAIHCQKQVIWEDWQLICLESQIAGKNGGYLADSELAFLAKCLATNPRFALIAVHHHCLPTHSDWMDTMLITNHNDFLALLGNYPNAKAVIHGHIHQQTDNYVGKVRVLATPSTCFQFAPGSIDFAVDTRRAAGFRLINLYNDGSLTTKVVRLSGPPQGLQASKYGY